MTHLRQRWPLRSGYASWLIAAAAGILLLAGLSLVEIHVVVRGDAEPGGRAAVLDVRVDHGAERVLLQVRELRHDVRVCVMS